MADQKQLSRDAYERLTAELEDLTGRGRIDIARKIEAAREHREPVEEPAILLIEKLVRPSHRGSEGLMALESTPWPTPKEPKAVGEPLEQLSRAQRADT